MQSADRALSLLVAFADDRRELGVSELAAEVGLHKSTVSRLFATLEARGLVARAGDRFVPGPELARLGALAARGGDLVSLARPALERLARETGETVNLAVREGEHALNVAQVHGAHLVGVGDWTGRGLPLHVTANGKVLLAFGGGTFPAALPALTEHSIVEPARLEADLAQARRRGYATAVEELEIGLVAIAAPVYAADARCVAAVSVSAPAFRLTRARVPEVGERCVAAANEVSAALGFRRAA
jgi:DNA-binding IclR family transcriptional regulator